MERKLRVTHENEIIHYSSYKGGRRHRPLSTQWDRQEFIAWDGEGIQPTIANPGIKDIVKPRSTVKRANPKPEVKGIPQPYVLFGCSKGDYVTNGNGLSTTDCFDLLLDIKQQWPNSIFVGFSINYDINQMLRDVPERILDSLYTVQHAYWRGYKIEWYPAKWLYLKQGNRKVRLFDVFGFFQSSFVKACEKYLGKTHPAFLKVQEGKLKRDSFQYSDLNYILEYYSGELELLVELMNALRTDLHNAGIDISSWHGPGAIASTVFKNFSIRKAKAETPQEVNHAAQYAYAGGRFEQFYCGRYEGTVYEYDINSAYPSAILGLPSLQAGTWEFSRTFEPESFGIWFVEISKQHEIGSAYQAESLDRPQPLFCRNKQSLITYPYETTGWYWTPEASIVADKVQYGWVLREDQERPFSFVAEYYERRREYKRTGNSTERALKLALNSMYGKMAQRIGYKDGIPKWHQLEWAGYVTSYTRAKLYQAAMHDPYSIIAMETDALFSTTPLDLPLSDNLGDWDVTTFAEISYLQSGFYYAIDNTTKEMVCKYRGLDKSKDSVYPSALPYDLVLSRLASNDWLPLVSSTTRYIGLGLSRHTSSVWRSWETNPRYLCIGGDNKGSKRIHRRLTVDSQGHLCSQCLQGATMYESLHPCHINGYAGPSYPHTLPWVTDLNEPQRMDQEMLWQ